MSEIMFQSLCEGLFISYSSQNSVLFSISKKLKVEIEFLQKNDVFASISHFREAHNPFS